MQDINLKEGLAANKYLKTKALIDLYALQFSYDYFRGNNKAVVCIDKELNKNIKKQKQTRKKLGSGSYGTVDSIIFDKQGKVKFSFKRAKYENSKATRHYASSPNVEVLMMIYLNQTFVFPDLCPHFVTYIGHNQCKNFMVLMMEQCDTTLENLIERKKNYSLSHNDWDSILFQIVFTLACVQHHNSYYRHNDLKLDNIFINIKSKPVKLYYEWDNVKYSITTRYIVKIADFGMSCMQGTINHRDILGGGYSYVGISQERHRLYDIHHVMAFVKKYYINNKSLKSRVNTPITYELIDRVTRYKVYKETGLHLMEKEKPSMEKGFPKNLVPLFKQFKTILLPKDAVVYSVIGNKKVTKKFKLKLRSKKDILNKPVIVKDNIVPDTKAIEESVKKYFNRKRSEDTIKKFFEPKKTHPPSLSNYSKKIIRQLIALEKSGSYYHSCPSDKIPNYKVPGRCTKLSSKSGQEILKLHKEYKKLLKYKISLEKLFNYKV
jgi:serine/threonine protein kinase